LESLNSLKTMAVQKNPTDAMEIWKQRVDSELKQAAEWEDNWGFLRTIGRSSSSPAIGRGQSDCGRSEATSDDFEIGGNKFRWIQNRSLVPKEKYARPITTAHETGWRPSLELFGCSHHGIKRDKSLWAEPPNPGAGRKAA